MEEWVGHWWHRFITQAADASHAKAAVRLDEMQRTLGLLFRAGGGAGALRIEAGSARRHGGPRGLLQRVAASGLRASQPTLEPDVLALPPQIAVHASTALNRDLYVWLAALAAAMQSGHARAPGTLADWIGDNLAASQAALTCWPGLRERHARLSAAELALRPKPASLRGAAREAEVAVQLALRGLTTPSLDVRASEVAPVWMWLRSAPSTDASAASRARQDRDDAARRSTAGGDRKRRHAERRDEGRERNPMMMFFRAESLLSWNEHVRVNRATDDEDDGHALAAADDMDTLTVARDGEACAARVRFDLDLPSAAADDLPLGPGERLPEWDWRHARLIEDHCAVQRVVARPGAPWRAPPALRATARRMRRRLEALRAAPRWQRGMPQGEELDLDAWVRFDVEARSSGRHSESPAIYRRAAASERSLATLLLADLSLSTDAYATPEARVIDVIREALYVFGEALDATGDAFEMLGFSSVRRTHVRIQHLKGFDEGWHEAARARVGAIKPGYYTRMGAAIRHATRRLVARPERQRLLLLLTDGKPNDLDIYEGRWGLEDTRHAVHEARAAGLTPFCITIDQAAHDYLPMLFGSKGYALVHRPQDLVARLAQAYASLTR